LNLTIPLSSRDRRARARRTDWSRWRPRTSRRASTSTCSCARRRTSGRRTPTRG